MTPLGNFEESENKSHVLLCVRSFIILSESTAANTLVKQHMWTRE